MKSFFKHSITLVIAFNIMSMMATTAEAGIFDRVQDIYNIPERVEEIQQQYDATKQAMEDQIAKQRELLERSQQQAEELLLQQERLQQINEQYREQTQMLAEENKNLLLQMDKLEQDRKSFFQKLIITISTFIALVILYSLSIRVWRFVVWRKQERNRRRKVLLP